MNIVPLTQEQADYYLSVRISKSRGAVLRHRAGPVQIAQIPSRIEGKRGKGQFFFSGHLPKESHSQSEMPI